VGGAAAGAILGNQVKGGDKGKVLGGLLGGAIGAVAAQKTGTEVQLAEGTEFSIALAAPVEITKR
jgi:outer membrane lipoprotein SlyB